MFKSWKLLLTAIAVVSLLPASINAGILPVPPGPDSPQLWQDHYNGYANITPVVSGGSTNFLLGSMEQFNSQHTPFGSPTMLPAPFAFNNPNYPKVAPGTYTNGEYKGVLLTTGLEVVGIDRIISTSSSGQPVYTLDTSSIQIGTDLTSIATGNGGGSIVYFGAQTSTTPLVSLYDVSNLTAVVNPNTSAGFSNNGNTFTGTDNSGNSFTIGTGAGTNVTLAAQFTFANLEGLNVSGSGNPFAPTNLGPIYAATYIDGGGYSGSTTVVLSSNGQGSEANELLQNGVSYIYRSATGPTTLTGTVVSQSSAGSTSNSSLPVSLSDPIDYVTVSPEPSSFILFGIGGLAFAAYRRRRALVA